MRSFPFFFQKAQNKSVMFQLFIQLLAIVLFMIAFLLIINPTLIQRMIYARAEASMMKIVLQVNSIDRKSASFYDEIKKIEDDDDTVYIELFVGDTNILYYGTVMNDLRNHIFFGAEGSEQFLFELPQPRNLVDFRNYKYNKNGNFRIGREASNNMEYLVYQSVLENGDRINIYKQNNIIETNASYTSEILRIIICVLGVALMVIFFIYAWLVTRPLIEMNDVTKRMAKMDFSKKCVAKTTNELGQLAENINSMSDSLAQAMGDLKDKNRQLELDIEHEHKMEQSRKEFVSNVSHELKTPIAIIQGYAEGLKLGISDNPKDNEEYLDVIIEESKKMNDIVLDLLELSYYESGSYKLDEESFSLNSAIEEYTNAQKMRINENNIDLQISLDEDMLAWGDESKISMVFNNYFSNAISHCEGENIIRISSQEIDGNYRISVFNTGKNISEENMEELWNNFYRGDKSHHREEGRFGLGLSIVVAIQNMHKMQYGCNNKENGVEFWFDVKKHVKDLTI